VEVGIGYPGMFAGVDRELLLSWAVRAEEAGFFSLSTGERVAYGNVDQLVTMAMAGAVTSRIKLMTTVTLPALHSPGVLAKQAATLDVLTNGRFTLGVGVGVRPDDFEVAAVPFSRRGVLMERHLELLRRMWSGEPDHGEPQIGPVPHTCGGPKVLIGPGSIRAARRVALADGIVTFGLGPDPTVQRTLFEAGRDAWRRAGRAGTPYFAAGAWFALGPKAKEKSLCYLRDYYSFMAEPAFDGLVGAMTLVDENNAPETIARFADAGVDELYLTPLVAELDQVDRLADLVGTDERRP
jgi:alkanesulfonate monooxygenase SsuD/methylene tetrahydromethanopterin reductase-like flavin-dependent oxidoreductase (luciferase family)